MVERTPKYEFEVVENVPFSEADLVSALDSRQSNIHTDEIKIETHRGYYYVYIKDGGANIDALMSKLPEGAYVANVTPRGDGIRLQITTRNH